MSQLSSALGGEVRGVGQCSQIPWLHRGVAVIADISANPMMWSAFEDSLSGTHAVDRSGPGLHALVIGISSYPKLGSNPFKLAQLTCAASSAAEFANWLLSAYPSGNGQPLRSVRLLLSPSPSEEMRLQELRASETLPARQDTVSAALTEWSQDCNSVAGNFAVLYAVGHGMAAGQNGPHLLLEIFGRARRSPRVYTYRTSKELSVPTPTSTKAHCSLIAASRSPDQIGI